MTDHVVVAVVDDEVKQTRCTACDTEHPFKDGKVPPRRKKPEAAAVLYERVLDGITEEGPAGNGDQPGPLPNLVVRPERKPAKGKRGAAVPVPAPAPLAPPLSPPEPPEPVVVQPAETDDEGPVHRRLIRATLPRPDGQTPVRPIPEFTMRLPGARGGFNRSGGHGNRFGNAAPQQQRGGHWAARPNGHHGGNRAGAAAPGGEARSRHKGGRSRGPRPHHKKSR